jgi:predicted nucleic acid-binding protein
VKAFIDTSVLLRVLFGEPGRLEEWEQIEEAYASRLLAVEVRRAIDRYRLLGQIDDEDVARLHEEARRALRSIDILTMTEPILRRAEQAAPTVVGTLDAIHLATALELETHLREPIVLATHDVQLARAARASGMPTIGA